MLTEAIRDRFGANEWLVEEMYERFLADPSSVDHAWHEFFADFTPAKHEAHEEPPVSQSLPPEPLSDVDSKQLRGAAAAIAKNMDASLSVPTATSVRAVPAKLMA
ncbi:hypothetical protein, partial [Amycolatopsis sp. NPDC052450]|uniref:2-oxoglutarate dehydrogenase E1 subunit family protein n=1 Tax=Amycolatopsis sp. NPDC052450 TaxID=3363937 RepID=UPI0037CAD049